MRIRSTWMTKSSKEAEVLWLAFSACLFIASSCGMTTAFGLLSPSLERLDYSASNIALVAAFGNLGTFSGIVSGFIINSVGVRYALYIATFLVWFGLFFIWLSVTEAIPSGIASMCFYIYLAQLGAATTSQSSSSTSLTIFPTPLGFKIASISKAYCMHTDSSNNFCTFIAAMYVCGCVCRWRGRGSALSCSRSFLR
jgi:hypothetical protein